MRLETILSLAGGLERRLKAQIRRATFYGMQEIRNVFQFAAGRMLAHLMQLYFRLFGKISNQAVVDAFVYPAQFVKNRLFAWKHNDYPLKIMFVV
jgi:hypothetical protein